MTTPEPPIEPETARIAARSRRQALDWGLVLLSQGIESTLEPPQAESGWSLFVPAEHYQAALETIRLYQLENRRWPWRREILEPGLLFDWGSLAWVVLLCLFFGIDNYGPGLRTPGLMDSTAVARGEWWRLFTAIWLHADITHLTSNAVLGVVLLGLAMARYGTGVGLLAACLAGAGGNLLALALPLGPHRSLGSSGMVMGALGLLAAQSFRLWSRTPHRRRNMIVGLLGGIMLFVLFGLNPDSDVVAHFGGFISGLAVGAMLARAPAITRSSVMNALGGLAFAVMVIFPWWLALRHGR